jgi:outer membrane lipoprotein-sorting protein
MKTFLAVLCFATLSVTQSQADATLDTILARMDKAAPSFHAMTANVEMVEYQKILNDSSTDSGSLKMQRKGKDVRAVVTFRDRWIGFLGQKVRVYFPNMNTYTDYDAGKNTDVVNQFLLLGFGASGKELAQSYDISLEGTEKVAGQDASKLVLIPKDQKVKERLTRIVVWIPADGANPIQQQFYEPSGNWRKVTYTNVVINPTGMPPTLEMKLPSGAKRQG